MNEIRSKYENPDALVCCEMTFDVSVGVASKEQGVILLVLSGFLILRHMRVY